MFSVTTKAKAAGASTLDADVSDTTTSTAPAFVTEQAVASFAASAAVVQLIWQAFQNAAGGWADSVWLPLGIAVVLGLGLSAPLLNDSDRPVGDWIKAIVFASVNTLVLWATALGVNSQLTS
jgi:hypothetical protein